MTTATIMWRRPADELPDADLDVLLSVTTPEGDRYVTLGAQDAEGWIDAQGFPLWRGPHRVEAWAHLPEPAAC